MVNQHAPQQSQDLVIERLFPAPVESLWKAFSDVERIKRWWGPEGFTAPFCEVDFRQGGKYLYCMRSPEGKDFWSTGTYREIMPMKRIVCTDSFSDAQGNVVPATYYGMSPDLPLELLVTFSFEAHPDGTRLRLEHAGLPEKEKDMCREGWNSSLNKLAASL